jgi:Mn-dependent DtxR family transcriptional regulator
LSKTNIQYADEDFLEAVDELELAGTNDVADEVGCKEKTAFKALRSLDHRGLILSKMVGGSRVWIDLTEDGETELRRARADDSAQEGEDG